MRRAKLEQWRPSRGISWPWYIFLVLILGSAIESIWVKRGIVIGVLALITYGTVLVGVGYETVFNHRPQAIRRFLTMPQIVSRLLFPIPLMLMIFLAVLSAPVTLSMAAIIASLLAVICTAASFFVYRRTSPPH